VSASVNLSLHHKIQHPGGLGKRAIKRLFVCVCVLYSDGHYSEKIRSYFVHVTL